MTMRPLTCKQALTGEMAATKAGAILGAAGCTRNGTLTHTASTALRHATAWLALLACTAHADCVRPESAQPMPVSGPVQAHWSTVPQPPQVGEPFALTLTLCPSHTELVRVDASMPEHRHGMNYKPSFLPLGEGRWQVDGMVWHMAGRWELRLDTRLDGAAHTLTQSVTLR